MKLTKVVLIGSIIVSLGIASIGCGKQANTTPSPVPVASEKSSILIGTANEGGAYFYLGNGLADVINKNTKIKATAQATAGGVENLRRINNQGMDLGFAATNDLKTTLDDKTLDRSKVMVLSAGHSNIFQVVVRADSTFTSVDQVFVKGNRIGVGEPGSAIQVLAENLLSVHNLTMKEIKAAPLSQSEQAKALKDKTIDAAILGGGIPTASISDVATSVGARILPVSAELLQKLQKKQPDLFSFNVPGGLYKGIDQPVPVYGSSAVIMVRANLPEETVYNAIKAIHEHSEDISKIHPSGKEYIVENAFRGADYYIKELGLKYHPGAIKWFKEKGVWKGDYQ